MSNPTPPLGIDRFLAPYSAAAFARFARRYANGPKSSAFYAIFCAVMAFVMFVGAGALLAAAAKWLYLDAYGVEAPGKILDASFHTDSRHIRWKKLTYEFTARPGDIVKGQLDRPVHELAGVADGNRFTVLYWDRYPDINSPRGVARETGIVAFVAGVLLLGCLHFGCLSWRMMRWRKSLIAASSSGAGQTL